MDKLTQDAVRVYQQIQDERLRQIRHDFKDEISGNVAISFDNLKIKNPNNPVRLLEPGNVTNIPMGEATKGIVIGGDLTSSEIDAEGQNLIEDAGVKIEATNTKGGTLINTPKLGFRCEPNRNGGFNVVNPDRKDIMIVRDRDGGMHEVGPGRAKIIDSPQINVLLGNKEITLNNVPEKDGFPPHIEISNTDLGSSDSKIEVKPKSKPENADVVITKEERERVVPNVGVVLKGELILGKPGVVNINDNNVQVTGESIKVNIGDIIRVGQEKFQVGVRGGTWKVKQIT